MASERPRAFLTGATGDVGSQTLKLLQETNMPIRIMCRRQNQVDDFESHGVDAVRGSLDDSSDELTQHMQGCDRLLLVSAATPKQLEHNLNAINAAIAAGVKWIIKVSAADARDEGNVPWVRAHAKADQYLQKEAEKHQVSWTILKPSAFMQNILSEAPAIKKGFLPQTSGHGKAGWIDTADIAAVASQLLLDGPERHQKQTYILTGPELISVPEMADSLSRQVGHRVRYLHLPGSVFGYALRLSGIDAWSANGLVAQFVEIVRSNKEGIDVSDAVQKLTGKPPTSFDDFAARHKADLNGFDVLPVIGAIAAVSVAFATSALIK